MILFALVKELEARDNRELLNASTSKTFDQVLKLEAEQIYAFSFESDNTTDIPKEFRQYPIFTESEMKVIIEEGSALEKTTYKTPPPTDEDNVALARTKVTQSGWQYHLQGIEFTTSDRNSIVNRDSNGQDLGFATMKIYDDQGAEITTELGELGAVKTVIDWEPPFDYEVLGGTIRNTADIVEDIYAYVVAVPDVPKAFGGSKDFICCINLKFIGANDKLEADGRAAKKMIYDEVNHTNKIRVILTHPAGVKRSLSLVLEVFKP